MMEVKLHGLEGVIEALQALPAEIVSKRGGPVRAALRKGGDVILKQLKINLRQVTARAGVPDEQSTSTGFLLTQAVTTRGKPPTDGKGERYLVRFRKKRYPDRKLVTALKTAHLLEYGSEKQPAEPFIRPAYETQAGAALRVIESDLAASIARITRKLARDAKAKGGSAT